MATVQIRGDDLRRHVAQRYGSAEAFIRAAGISRTAWEHLVGNNVAQIDVGVLGKVLHALHLDVADLLEYRPGTAPGGGRVTAGATG